MIQATTYPDGVTYYTAEVRGVTHVAYFSAALGEWSVTSRRFRRSPGTHRSFRTVGELSAALRPFRDLAALVELAPIVAH